MPEQNVDHQECEDPSITIINNSNNNKYHYILSSGMRGPKHVGELPPEAHPGQLWQLFDD